MNRARQAPAFVEPMKPIMVARLPDGDEWSYEVKWDGYRALLWKHGDEIRLYSRNEKRLDSRFPEVVEDALGLPPQDVLLDGEVVALGQDGRPHFHALQNTKRGEFAIVYYVFDVLYLNGTDLRKRPLAERREIARNLSIGTRIRFSVALPGKPSAIAASVKRLGLEGIVAKRLGSSYSSGARSGDWQKIRLNRGQEFVIGGYAPGLNLFESVLVGYYEGKRFIFAARVRAGFTKMTRMGVWELIRGLETSRCPFSNLPDVRERGRWSDGITTAEMGKIQWVRPRVVIEVEFVEWTSGGRLRHAAYKGIRTDKPPTSVVREDPG